MSKSYEFFRVCGEIIVATCGYRYTATTQYSRCVSNSGGKFQVWGGGGSSLTPGQPSVAMPQSSPSPPPTSSSNRSSLHFTTPSFQPHLVTGPPFTTPSFQPHLLTGPPFATPSFNPHLLTGPPLAIPS